MRQVWLRRSCALLCLTPGLSLLPIARAAEPERPFVPVRVDRKGGLPDAAREAAFAEIARRDASPQHLVVLVHGFDTPVYRSNREYSTITEGVRNEFSALGERAQVIGFQWPSDPGPRREWLPASFFHFLLRKAGLRNAVRDPYRGKVERARAVGRRGLRQLVMGLEDRFPGSRIHVFVHSLGSEVALQAVTPDPTRHEMETAPIYRPDRALNLDVVALAGADLDADFARSRPDVVPGLPKLIWITIPEVGSSKDRVLGIRRTARGKAAAGNEVLQLRSRQIDGLVVKKRMVLDTFEIPRNHMFRQYYTRGRLRRLAEAAATLRTPAAPRSALLREMDEILALPADVKAISAHLASQEQTARIFALWRLEHLLCGSADHLANGYALHVSRMAFKHPQRIERERELTSCKVVKEGYWPSSYFIQKIMNRRASR